MKRFVLFLFVVVFILSFVSISSPLLAEEIEGTLEVIMVTEIPRGKCEPLYFINIGGKRTQFSLPAHAPPVSPGQKIKISGQWKDDGSGKRSFRCRKLTAVAAAEPAVKKSFASMDNLSGYLPRQRPVLRGQNILVVCLNSPDTKDSPEWGEEKIEDKIFSNKHSLNAYWKACSIDQNGQPQVWLTGDIFNDGKWKMMPKSWTEYGYDSIEEWNWHDEFIDDLIKLIDPEIDFSKYEGLVVFRAGKNWHYDWSTVGKTTINTDEGEVEISLSFLTENDIDIGNDYAAHESGHGLFSLLHAENQSVSSGQINKYGDWWENRGAQYGLLDGLHKWILGWLNISQTKTTTSNFSGWLDQRELASSGIKLLVIPLAYNVVNPANMAGHYVLMYIEYHRGLGEFDSRLYFRNENKAVDPNNIVLVRKSNEEIDSYRYNSLVYVASGDYGGNCLDLETEEFCDSNYENIKPYGICVKVLQKIGTDVNSQVEVRITLTSDYSIPTIPTPIPTPTPTPTPIVICKADTVTASPNKLSLKRKGSKKVTVTVTCDGEGLEGQEVTATINAPGKKRISVSPSSAITDENSRATFTVTAKKKGNSGVTFKAGDVKKSIIVKVR